MIDSEQVPRGKGEKHPGEGDEIVSETTCLQKVGGLCPPLAEMPEGLPIEEWANEFVSVAKSNSYEREV